ncbi:unnamed protein product, partial [Arabidopsis halleri]
MNAMLLFTQFSFTKKISLMCISILHSLASINGIYLTRSTLSIGCVTV